MGCHSRGGCGLGQTGGGRLKLEFMGRFARSGGGRYFFLAESATRKQRYPRAPAGET